MQAVNTARNAYSLYTNGLAGMVSTMGAYISTFGNMLGMSSIGNFGVGMQGAYLAPGLAGPTTAGASGAMGIGAKVGSTIGGMASNPLTWILAALLGSHQFGQAGVRIDENQIRKTQLSRTSFAIDPLPPRRSTSAWSGQRKMHKNC
ncbi:hypothetical protein [Pseudomonas sp. KB-10]|uniref:hypothetical protein n=1 Tax=Pseudomonas sp. KB-10 TaxID=2292264 RepID=UPI001BAF37E1|nr:hypothetical protein [Pseudomonas sp. KB-10]